VEVPQVDFDDIPTIKTGHIGESKTKELECKLIAAKSAYSKQCERLGPEVKHLIKLQLDIGNAESRLNYGTVGHKAQVVDKANKKRKKREDQKADHLAQKKKKAEKKVKALEMAPSVIPVHFFSTCLSCTSTSIWF